MSVEVEVVGRGSAEIVEAFGRLLPQLSRSAPPLDAAAVDTLVAWPGTRCWSRGWTRRSPAR